MQGLLWRHRGQISSLIRENRLTQPLVYGPSARVHVDKTAVVNNALLNTVGGEIFVGPQAFFGHDVCLLTGTHDPHKIDAERKESSADLCSGRDIRIEQGAWLATRVIVVGPATIGKHAVVGAGSVVLGDVEPGALYAGVPARKVKDLDIQ